MARYESKRYSKFLYSVQKVLRGCRNMYSGCDVTFNYDVIHTLTYTKVVY